MYNNARTSSVHQDGILFQLASGAEVGCGCRPIRLDCNQAGYRQDCGAERRILAANGGWVPV